MNVDVAVRWQIHARKPPKLFTVSGSEDQIRNVSLMRSEKGWGAEETFRIVRLTAFFVRNLEPRAQVVQAINNKIAQEQQIETERHRVEV